MIIGVPREIKEQEYRVALLPSAAYQLIKRGHKVLVERGAGAGAGYPDSDYTFWNGMLVPARTPRAIVNRLHEETAKVLRQPGVNEKLKPQGLEPMPLKPEEFDALIAREVETNKALVKAAGLKFN